MGKETYKYYRKRVFDMMNTNAEQYNKCIKEGFVLEKNTSMNGEPYRLLTEEEFNQKIFQIY